MSDLKPGEFIAGEYRVRRVFGGHGESGMGVVYLVEGRSSECPFVLKTFQSKRATPSSLVRFKAETETWINIGKHPNVVQCHWVREFSDQLFVAAEYIWPDGLGRNTLTQHLASGGYTLRQQHDWIAHFCFGMKHAMANGMKAHRDIKPDNLMVDNRGRLKITDFGLAKGLALSEPSEPSHASDSDYDGLTIAGTAFGTPPFMSPEQFVNSAAVDHRADIYSLGVVIYMLISGGKMPIVLSTRSQDYFRQYALAHSQQRVAQLDHPLMPIAAKCLEKHRDRRFQAYDEVLAAVEHSCRKHGFAVPCDEQDARAEFERQIGIAMSLVKLDRPGEGIPRLLQMKAQWPESPEVYNELSQAYQRLGKMDEALAATETALHLDQYSTADWNNLGGILANLGRRTEAKNAYGKALQIDAENTGAMMGLAQLLMLDGELQDAKTWCELALFWRPEKPMVLQVASDCYYACGEFARAIQLLDKLLATNPDDAIAWSKRGNAASQLGRQDEAIGCYDKAIEAAPRTQNVWKFRGGSAKGITGAVPADAVEVDAWNGKGLVFRALGQIREALACYDKATKIDPKKADVWCNKGNAFFAESRHEEALQCFDKAVALNPKDMKSWCNRGVALKALSRLEEAVASYDKALAIDPRDVKTWFNKGNALAAQEDYREALVCFQEADKLGDPNAAKYVEQCRRLLDTGVEPAETTSAGDAQELFARAAASAKTNQHADAVSCYESGLKLEPGNAAAWFNLGHSLGFLGRHQDVVKCCERALQMHPSFAPLWILKGLGFLSMERFQDATSCFQEAERLGDGSAASHMARCRMSQAEWYFRLGSGYQQDGNNAEAVRCYEKGLALNPSGNAVIWSNKGAALLALKRNAEAVICFDRAIALRPEDWGRGTTKESRSTSWSSSPPLCPLLRKRNVRAQPAAQA